MPNPILQVYDVRYNGLHSSRVNEHHYLLLSIFDNHPRIQFNDGTNLINISAISGLPLDFCPSLEPQLCCLGPH